MLLLQKFLKWGKLSLKTAVLIISSSGSGLWVSLSSSGEESVAQSPALANPGLPLPSDPAPARSTAGLLPSAPELSDGPLDWTSRRCALSDLGVTARPRAHPGAELEANAE